MAFLAAAAPEILTAGESALPEIESALPEVGKIFSKAPKVPTSSSSKGLNILSKLNEVKQARIKTLTSQKGKEIEELLSSLATSSSSSSPLSSSFPSSNNSNNRTEELENILGGIKRKEELENVFEGNSKGGLKSVFGGFNSKGGLKGVFGDVKLPSVSTLLVRGLMIFIGFLLIIQGIFSVKTYENRKVKDVKPAVIKSYDAASFFVGTGVGIILHQGLSFFDFKLVDKVFIYILLLGIAIFAGYVTNRMNVISKESDTNKAQTVALTAESFALGMIGVVIGVIISFTFVTISKFVKGEVILYVEVAGVIVGSLFAAAASANQFYLYDNTGKKYKSGLVVSILVFILSILAIVGAIVLVAV
jgi:hypothetical protein